MSGKVALIFGYGPRVGVDVANAFAAKGYKVAVVSRSDKTGQVPKDFLALQADMMEPEKVEGVFKTVIEKLGHPSVVVYNASANATAFDRTVSATKEIAAFQAEYNANVVSAYVAARLAVDSFNALGSGSGTYIYTGNKLNFIVVPPLLSGGIGKAGAAHMVHYFAEEYKGQGHKFYYADEREANGNPAYSDINGPAHAEFYTSLAEGKTQQSWLATFVKGKGYVDFQELKTQEKGALKEEPRYEPVAQ